MNKLKRFFMMDQYSDEAIAAEYANMSDGKLASLKPSELSKVGLKCYQTELELRKSRGQPKASLVHSTDSSK